MSKKIFILLGNPDKDTMGGHFADVYEQAAREAGHEVRRTNIGELQFDPILHKGYKEIQALEPDLLKVQEDMKWCNHFVLIYPNWWSSMPAILKGMFDRMFLPGFAYHFNHGGMPGWHKMLKGRSGRVIVTMDNWPLMARILFGDFTNEIGRAILWFAGFHPVKIKKIGPVKHFSEAKKQHWSERVKNWAQHAR